MRGKRWKKGKTSSSGKKATGGEQGPLTLRDHIDDVKGNSLARFLTDD